jgi:ABC-2 type transport system ATP-binding protein
MNGSVIEAENLTKTFRDGIVAVKDLDLQIKRGAVYGLLGRNGSGKTTALRLLMGLLQPDRGEARVLGCDFWRAPRSVRTRVAYVAQTQQLPGWMTVQELCRCQTRWNERWDQSHARALAEGWKLPWRRQVGGLSAGEQRKVAIAVAFASRPEVLILDEPSSGLDVIARRELLEQIVDAITQTDGCTVLLSTHIVSDLERVADHVGVIHGGRIAMSARLEDLLNHTRRVQVIFEGADPPANFTIPGAVHSRQAGSVLNAVVRLTDGRELDGLRGSANVRVQVFPIGLEDLFIELFGRDPQPGDEMMNDWEIKEERL